MPKVTQCNSALRDNSGNSHAFTAPTTHRFFIEDYFDPARLQLLSDLNYNFTLQQAVNLKVNIMQYKYDQELSLQKIAEDTNGTAPACVGATS